MTSTVICVSLLASSSGHATSDRLFDQFWDSRLRQSVQGCGVGDCSPLYVGRSVEGGLSSFPVTRCCRSAGMTWSCDGTSCQNWSRGGTAAAAPPPFRPSDRAVRVSCPLVTPYYCRLGDLLCLFLYPLFVYYFVCVFCVFFVFSGLFSFVAFSFSTLILLVGSFDL